MTRIANISREMVLKIPIDAPIISISDRYSQWVDIPNHENRPVLRVNFFTGDHASPGMEKDLLTVEKAKEIIAFVKTNFDKDIIYVQCGEGRIRSYTVCDALQDVFIDAGLQRDVSLSSVVNGIIDKHTGWVMIQASREEAE